VFVPIWEFNQYGVGGLDVIGNFCGTMVLGSDYGVPFVGAEFPQRG
jgi:hypothetical protein